MYADQPIREFGETVTNMLIFLAHGEIGGLGELMAMNLYLNNQYNTVFMHKIPIESIVTKNDFEIAQKRIRNVHNMILGKLYSFWDTWCSDNDVVTQYRLKYKNVEFIVILDEMDKNIKEADDLIHDLKVSNNTIIDINFDPKKITLTDFINNIILKSPMPNELLLDIKWNSFVSSYEFNPQSVYDNHKSIFNTIYICFYWTTITHLKLGVKVMDDFEQNGINIYHLAKFKNLFIKFMKPLSVFHTNRSQYISKLLPEAWRIIDMLISFLLQLHYDLMNATNSSEVISTRPIIQKFIENLTADMVTISNIEPPSDYFNKINYKEALKLMKSNYQAFARLVSSTTDFKEDQINAVKLKKFLFFISEAVEFDLSIKV